jgi:hypothetical protein
VWRALALGLNYGEEPDSLRQEDFLREAETTELSVGLGNYSASFSFEGSAFDRFRLSQDVWPTALQGDISSPARSELCMPIFLGGRLIWIPLIIEIPWETLSLFFITWKPWETKAKAFVALFLFAPVPLWKSQHRTITFKYIEQLSRVLSIIAIVRFYVLNVIQFFQRLSRFGGSLGAMGAVETALLSAMSARLAVANSLYALQVVYIHLNKGAYSNGSLLL